MKTSCSIEDCPNEAIVFWPNLCKQHEIQMYKAEAEWQGWKENQAQEDHRVINFPDQSVNLRNKGENK